MVRFFHGESGSAATASEIIRLWPGLFIASSTKPLTSSVSPTSEHPR